VNDTDKTNTFLCEDNSLQAKVSKKSGTSDASEETYADEFMRKFMTESSAEDLEPDVEKGASDAPLTAKILEENVITALKQIFDPEIPINIYDLGLIYKVNVDDQGRADVDMTLTAPGCPVAQTFPGQVEQAVCAVDGISDAHVELVWDPPWTKARMSQSALLELGLL